MDCLRCNHRMPPDQVKRGRQWHTECPARCADEWCSHPDHAEDRLVERPKEKVADLRK